MIPYVYCNNTTLQIIANRISYNVYFLQSTTSNKTYVGYSMNPFHRLRQHNGELVGGAKRTQVGRPWRIVCIVAGFPTAKAALQFEYRWLKIRATRQRITNGTKGERRYKKCPHITTCNEGLQYLLNCQWTSTSPAPKSFPLTVHWNVSNYLVNYSWNLNKIDYECWSIYQGYINYDELCKLI